LEDVKRLNQNYKNRTRKCNAEQKYAMQKIHRYDETVNKSDDPEEN
jgi:hypothetical protein